uniref:hypothetical protein n=1 Tax=Pseudomonas sp. TE3-3-F2023 TaxID=3119004 RepID=UPI00403F28D4
MVVISVTAGNSYAWPQALKDMFGGGRYGAVSGGVMTQQAKYFSSHHLAQRLVSGLIDQKLAGLHDRVGALTPYGHLHLSIHMQDRGWGYCSGNQRITQTTLRPEEPHRATQSVNFSVGKKLQN